MNDLQDTHDVVTVGSESENEESGTGSENPNFDGGLRSTRDTGREGGVDDGEGTAVLGIRNQRPVSEKESEEDEHSVGDIVSSVSERRGTGSQDLKERVEMLDLVGVRLDTVVSSLHSLVSSRSGLSVLQSVNIDGRSV